MKITSQAFEDGGKIPDKYTKYGENLIPPLHLVDVPLNARSVALVVEDPDASGGTFNHWLLYNLDPRIHDIQENSVPMKASQGRNDFGTVEYDGPMPPSGEHRYFFKAFALDTMLALAQGIARHDLDREMSHHIVASAQLMGRYAHQ